MGTFITTTSLEIIMVDTSEILSKRYDVASAAFQTSTSTPPVVSTLCKWLSAGYMYENLSRGGKDAFKRADRYINKAMGNMGDIVNYKANIVDSTGSAITEGAQSIPLYSNTNEYHDTFAEDDPLCWNIDSNKLDDIEDDRDS